MIVDVSTVGVDGRDGKKTKKETKEDRMKKLEKRVQEIELTFIQGHQRQQQELRAQTQQFQRQAYVDSYSTPELSWPQPLKQEMDLWQPGGTNYKQEMDAKPDGFEQKVWMLTYGC